MRLLGLDISTSCIGHSIIDYIDNKFSLIDIGHFQPLKSISNKRLLKDLDIAEFLDMLKNSKEFIITLLQRYNPDKVCIEDYIRYMQGGSGANTILPLAALNRTLCLSAYEYVDCDKTRINICNVVSIRSLIRRAAKLDTIPKKEELPSILEKLMNIKLQPVYEQKKKKVVISPISYDQSDSVATIYYSTMKDI